MAEYYRHHFYPSMQPEQESTADREQRLDAELSGPWSEEPLKLAYGSAEMHMRTAQDQMIGLAILLATGVEDSLMTLARGAVEAYARAAWLLDTEIDGRQRLARCMTERLNGLHFENYLSGRIGRELDTDERISRIRQSAEDHDFEVVVERRTGRLHVGDTSYPGQTRVVQLLFEPYGGDYGIRAYADLSAYAHSSLAAFTARVPRLIAESEPPASAEDGPEPPVERGVVLALVAFDEAMSRFLTLYGWNLGPWRSFVRQAHADIRLILRLERSAIDLVRVRPE